MTGAATAPILSEEANASVEALLLSVSCSDANSKTWEADYQPANNTQSTEFQHDKPRVYRYVIRRSADTTIYAVRTHQYGKDPDAWIFVDFGEPEAEFPRDHLAAVRFLRTNGRPSLADELVAMLQDIEDDSEEVVIDVASLRDMARLITERKNFADPSISSDRLGVIHAQWRILGDGLLVMSFLGREIVLLTAQADERCDREGLDISDRGHTLNIVRKYEHLVPNRN